MNADIPINETRNRLWQRIMFAMTFRWGFYATVGAVLLVLVTKILGGQTFPWYGLTIAGLGVGLIIGLFKRPSSEHTAIYLDYSAGLADIKSGTENYFATLLYCLNKDKPNPLEETFRRIIPEVRNRQIPYNLYYPLVFVISVMMVFVITLAPFVTTDSHGYAQGDMSGGITPLDGQGKIAAAGLANNAKLKKEIEILLKDIKQGKLNLSAILGKVNSFVSAAGSEEELAEIKVLLEKIKPLLPEPQVTLIEGAIEKRMQAARPSGNGFSLVDTASGGSSGDASGGAGLETRASTSNDAGRILPSKTIEEVLRKPYWPAEYDEIVKRYFGTTDEHR